MSDVSEQKDYMWLVKTSKGDFLVTVIGKWTEKEAMEKLQAAFKAIAIEIAETIRRKRASGPNEMMCTLLQEEEATNLLGFQFYASNNMWAACGRGAEYEAETTRLKNLPSIE